MTKLPTREQLAALYDDFQKESTTSKMYEVVHMMGTSLLEAAKKGKNEVMFVFSDKIDLFYSDSSSPHAFGLHSPDKYVRLPVLKDSLVLHLTDLLGAENDSVIRGLVYYKGEPFIFIRVRNDFN